MDKDIKACEEKLGKEPSPVIGNTGDIRLSQSITERLKNGTIEGERVDNYETYWINKLACIDESHSVRNNIDIDEAEEKLKILTNFIEKGIKKDTNKNENINELDTVRSCLESVHGETLKCDAIVEKFIEKVDELMYDAVRKESSNSFLYDKKLTFAERFKRDAGL